MKNILAIILTVVFLAGCAPVQTAEAESNADNKTGDGKTQTFVYPSENGDIEVPMDPQRIVILDSSAAGAILMLDGSVVGHEYWTGTNPLFKDYLLDSTEVSVDNLEQIIALSPDLIIMSSANENYEELSQIAPTAAFTYGKQNYLETVIEYGRLVNKEDEARAWVKDFKERAQRAGQKIKEKYGEDVTISVMEAYGDEMYLFGDNWGRGTQIVYQEMGLGMTEPVKEVALKDGYYSISSEVIPEYKADLMILSHFQGANLAFMETQMWKNIDAVKENKVLFAESEKFYMTGPITLEYQLAEIAAFFGE